MAASSDQGDPLPPAEYILLTSTSDTAALLRIHVKDRPTDVASRGALALKAKASPSHKLYRPFRADTTYEYKLINYTSKKMDDSGTLEYKEGMLVAFQVADSRTEDGTLSCSCSFQWITR